MVAHSFFNVFRDEERVRLANSAHAQFPDIDRMAYSKEDMRYDLGLFALELEKWLQGSLVPTLVKGDLNPKRLTFWLDPYIIENAGTLLFSPPGKGKSWLALLMAVSVDAGESPLWTVTQTPTMFVNLERSAKSIAKRLADVNGVLGLARDREMLVLNARGRGLAELNEPIQLAVKKHKIGLVVLDSISRAGLGTLVEDRTANAIIDTLNGFGCSWLALGHTARADDTHSYGSIHFEAGEDVGIRLVSQETADGLGLGLEVVKANDIKKPPRAFYSLSFDSDGLVEADTARDNDFPELFELLPDRPLDKVRDAMSNAGGKSTTTEIAKNTGLDAGFVNKLLKHPSFVRLQREGREVFYGLTNFPSSVPTPGSGE
ncbi:MAG: helicase RepA family protein [Nanoarchaeota archaeon]|nr:helicase RepA family protein [Nanoarchaeota archaeon]